MLQRPRSTGTSLLAVATHSTRLVQRSAAGPRAAAVGRIQLKQNCIACRSVAPPLAQLRQAALQLWLTRPLGFPFENSPLRHLPFPSVAACL
jgi:hypothetical protein